MANKVHEIRIPQLGESISEAIVSKILQQQGAEIATDAPILELETDKVSIEVLAPKGGVITELKVQEGATVNVDDVVGLITEGIQGTKAEAAAPPEAKPEKTDQEEEKAVPTASEKSQPANNKTQSVRAAGPAARRALQEHNVEPNQVKASGPRGTMTPADVIRAAQAPAPQSRVTAEPGTRKEDPRGEEVVPMSRLRQRIAERLKYAQNTAALLTTVNEIDLQRLIDLRQSHREMFENRHGVRLGFMSFFVTAATIALQDFPAVNAEIFGDSIIYKHYYDIGIAVGTPQGLVVPILRDADKASLAEIEKSILDYGKRAREGRLTIDEMMGGTFSITNGGLYGSLLSTPIINPPQTAILGLHKIMKRPVVDHQDQVVVRPMMYVALSYDHRLIDGKDAVTFLVRIKELIEDPSLMLLE